MFAGLYINSHYVPLEVEAWREAEPTPVKRQGILAGELRIRSPWVETKVLPGLSGLRLVVLTTELCVRHHKILEFFWARGRKKTGPDCSSPVAGRVFARS